MGGACLSRHRFAATWLPLEGGGGYQSGIGESSSAAFFLSAAGGECGATRCAILARSWMPLTRCPSGRGVVGNERPRRRRRYSLLRSRTSLLCGASVRSCFVPVAKEPIRSDGSALGGPKARVLQRRNLFRSRWSLCEVIRNRVSSLSTGYLHHAKAGKHLHHLLEMYTSIRTESASDSSIGVQCVKRRIRKPSSRDKLTNFKPNLSLPINLK